MRVSIWFCCAWVETHARFQSVTETHIKVHRNWWVSLCNRKHILNTLRVFLRLAAWSVETHAHFLHCSTLWWESHVRFHVFFDFWRETHACFLRLGFLWWETQARFQIQALQRRETLFFRFSVWKSLICARLYSACCVSTLFHFFHCFHVGVRCCPQAAPTGWYSLKHHFLPLPWRFGKKNSRWALKNYHGIHDSKWTTKKC